MFAPKLGRPQTKTAASSASTVAPVRSGPVDHSGVEPVVHLSHSIGRATPESITGLGTPRGVSWNFSNIPLFSRDQANRPQSSFPSAALRDALQSPGVPLEAD